MPPLDGSAEVLSEKRQTVMYEFQPWQEPPPEAVGDAAQLQQLRP
jgi:hypothetical protein